MNIGAKGTTMTWCSPCRWLAGSGSGTTATPTPRWLAISGGRQRGWPPCERSLSTSEATRSPLDPLEEGETNDRTLHRRDAPGPRRGRREAQGRRGAAASGALREGDG